MVHSAPDLTRLYQDVLLKRVDLASACAALSDTGERQLAYEMAVCVCDADGRQTDSAEPMNLYSAAGSVLGNDDRINQHCIIFS
jgi:hypothetical protein